MNELAPVDCSEIGLPWYVAHTRPRCEKKLFHYCNREAIHARLPCFKSIKRYGRKTVEFVKPLFPGYLFFRASAERARSVLLSDYTANLLEVFDQNVFERQLKDIMVALDSGCAILGAMDLSPGKEVRITEGPLAGMTGRVEHVSEQTAVLIRLDFLGRGAALVVDGACLEILG